MPAVPGSHVQGGYLNINSYSWTWRGYLSNAISISLSPGPSHFLSDCKLSSSRDVLVELSRRTPTCELMRTLLWLLLVTRMHGLSSLSISSAPRLAMADDAPFLVFSQGGSAGSGWTGESAGLSDDVSVWVASSSLSNWSFLGLSVAPLAVMTLRASYIPSKNTPRGPPSVSISST